MCGTPLQEGVIFCPKCGANVGQATFQQPIAPQQPYYGQTQPYAPMPKKSNKKLIIAIAAIVAIIIVIGLAVFFLVSSWENEDNLVGKDKFVGTWEIESVTTESDLNGINTQSGFGEKITFKSDGTLEMTFMGTNMSGSWEIKNGKICIKQTGSSNETCTEYKFSNGDKTLTITSSGTVEDWDGTEYTQKSTTVLKKVTTSSDDDGNDNVNDYTIDDILGSWDMEEDPTYGSNYDQIWTFYNNGSLKMDSIYIYSGYDETSESSTYTTWATYELKNYKLCLTYTDYSDQPYEVCFDISISNNGNTLALTYYTMSYNFIKIT